jgi:predicted nucleic acid-binding protein
VTLRVSSTWATQPTLARIETICWQTLYVLFADTGALFAFLVQNDANHLDAVRAEAAIRSRREQLWTIDPVLTELWLLLRREIGVSRSDELVAGVLDRGVQRQTLEDQDFTRVWQLGRQWVDLNFSLTDRQAFAVLERTHRQRAWFYDKDFSVIRLGPRRERALDLVR